MAAYATQQREASARGDSSSSNRLELALSQAISGQTSSSRRGAADAVRAESSILDQLLDHIADRLAVVITDRLVVSDNRPDEWFDSRHAAEYLGGPSRLASQAGGRAGHPLRAGRSWLQALLRALRPGRVDARRRTASPPRINPGSGGVSNGHGR
jgi:hypothetical protein